MPIPGDVFWVYLTGVAHLLACTALLIRQKVRLASLLLIFALSIQLPAVIGGDMGSLPSLLKDLSLSGAAWFIAGHAALIKGGEEVPAS